MPTVAQGLPGLGSDRAYVERIVRKSLVGIRYMPGGKIISGAVSRDPAHTGYVDVLRPGTLMGRITATGLYAPSIVGVLGAAYATATSVNAVTVAAAAAAEIVRRQGGATGTVTIVGPATANGVIHTETKALTAVNQSTGVLTLASDFSNNYAAGSFIFSNDGSETPRCLIDDNAFVKVTNADGVSIDVPFPRPLIGGDLDSSQIVNWPSDTTLQNWIVTSLNAAGVGLFTFDHLH